VITTGEIIGTTQARDINSETYRLKKGVSPMPRNNKKSADLKRDVFISYSHNDIKWVKDCLLPMIESWQLDFAIDHSDFLPGWRLASTMREFITTSKHVIFVCTQSFIESNQCREELETVRAQDPGSIKQKAIPVVLDVSAVPDLLSDTIWCNLHERMYDTGEWRRLCKALGGEWSSKSDRILSGLHDLTSFFGNMRDNNTETIILARSHSTSEIQGVSNALSTDSAIGLSHIYTFLAEAGKTKRIKLVLSDGGGCLSDHFDENAPMNLIIFGGTSQGNRILNRTSKGLIRYKQNSDEPKYCYEIRGKLFVPKQDHMSFIIYKSRTEADNTLLVLFSPWSYANRLAAQYFGERYWTFVNHERDKEFLSIYEVENQDSDPILVCHER